MTERIPDSPLDTLRQYEIPEGVTLHLRVAGPVVRACAWAIDALIRTLIYLALAILLGYLGELGLGVMLIGLFLIEWFYPVVFELHNGATPGKRAMGILVIQENGTPVTPAASVIRNLLRSVDFLPFLYGIGLVSMLSNRSFQRLGDLTAGTLVVYRDQNIERMEPTTSTALKPPMDLSEEEQLVILNFAERRETLSEERRQELAELLSPQTGLQGGAAEQALYRYANWILKGR
ncbi:MAG: RDD family protein [Candidatus Thiodiazotropha taylori]|nr:RDD family protein [Candidatus Thiodiazotropha taylori]MCG8029384.1 RDD family protein [Candidatus Thiodiazotropha taylori]MCG8079442.1 RDD family protein [Candidatus Thiodiazotropha taylori]MCG8082348.1 RDD family protein [Candidatus Thiodiazotropha taylori]MCG8089889.1 RDD family protein [Candidatus Thiodiazotropha taylori]